MVKYELLNPCILGQFVSTYDTQTSLEAATQFWNDLTPHITNNLPEMYITLQSGGGLHHFKIREKISSGSKMANYSIKEISLDLNLKEKKAFLNQITKIKSKRTEQIKEQTGGNEKKEKRERYKGKSSSSSSDSNSSDSEDSEDSEDDDAYFNFSRYKRLSNPIVYWHYTPVLYKITKFFTPTFNIPLTPYIHIWNPWV